MHTEIDSIKVLSEIVQTVGIPALVIIFYMIKEWKQGDRITKAMEQMVLVAQQVVTSNETVVNSINSMSKDIGEMKVRMEMLNNG